MPVWIKDESGLPVGPYRVLITRNVLKPEEIKYFLSNAPLSAPVGTLLLVAFSRWRIERMFQDSKDELGMDHFEVRRYLSIQRHLILTCVSHLFLAEFRLDQGGKKKGAHHRPGEDGHEGPGPGVGSWGAMLPQACGDHRGAIAFNARAQRRRPPGAPQANHPPVIRDRCETQRLTHVSMAKKVA
jgi:hypothetical protein